MLIVELNEAESRLPELVQAAAADGEPFIIARDGEPLVKVVAFDATESGPRRTGFLRGHGYSVPDDFDAMAAGEIEGMFEGRDEDRAS